MRLSIAAGVAVCATAAHAFVDSSPFVMFSTADLPGPDSDAQLQTSSAVLSSAKALLSSCPTTRYIIVSQPNAHAADIRSGQTGACSPEASALCAAVSAEAVRSRFTVAEVLGSLAEEDIAHYVRTSCAEKSIQVDVREKTLEALPSRGLEDGERRRKAMGVNDKELSQLMADVAAGGADYTVLYFSDPNEMKTYAAEFPLEAELKRDVPEQGAVFSGKRQEGGSNISADAGLFDRYQYFTPGIFHAFIVLFVLLAVLYGGLSAISSLEIPYGAFDKVNGPAGQKK